MFKITSGTVGTGKLSESGLGFHLPEWTITGLGEELEESASSTQTSEKFKKVVREES